MTKPLALIEIMIWFCVHLAWSNASTFRSYTFQKQPMSSSGILDTTEIRNFSVSSALKCSLACAKNSACKAIQLTEQQPNGKFCHLLNTTGRCEDVNVNDILIPYYEINTLSTLKTVLKFSHDGPSTEPDPRSIWRVDCLSTFCRYSAMIGIRDPDSALQTDLDFIYCGSYGGDLMFDLSNSVTVPVRSTEAQQCPDNMVATAIWDSSHYFETPNSIKCTALMNGWKVDYGKCETKTIVRQVESVCDQVDGHPAFIVGIFSPITQSYAFQSITCCALFK